MWASVNKVTFDDAVHPGPSIFAFRGMVINHHDHKIIDLPETPLFPGLLLTLFRFWHESRAGPIPPSTEDFERQNKSIFLIQVNAAFAPDSLF